MKVRSLTKKLLVEKVESFNFLESDELSIHSFAPCAIFQKIYHYGLSRRFPNDEAYCQLYQKKLNKIFSIVLSYDQK